MPLPPLSDEARRCARAMQDALAGNESVREGLRDEDAIPLIDWGRAQAEALAARRTMPEAEAADAGMLLADLLSTMTWAVVYRHSKDAAWLSQTLHTLNDLSRDLAGDEAPQLSDETIAAWVAGHAERSDGDLLRELMAHFALPETLSAPPAAPTIPPPAAPPAPIPPAPAAALSTLAGLTPSAPQTPTEPEPSEAPKPKPHSFFGLRLPGRRRAAPPAETPTPPGDDHD